MQVNSNIPFLSYPFGMLMPQRYKEWNSSNCITSTKDVWVTVIDTYYIDMPHVDWATLGGTRFDPSDEYGHPIFDETNTLTGIYIQYTEDGLYGDFSSLEVGGNYDFVFDVPNVLGTNLQMQVVELLEDRTERILATKDIAGPEENLSINFTPTTRDIRVKVVRLDAEGSEVPYISIKNLKWYYYHQQLETQLVNICSGVEDRYRFGFNGMHKDNEMKGIGNSLDMGDRWLDVRIGRTPKPDAKIVLYPSVSPFSYALNTPIVAKDPDGKVVVFVNGYRFIDAFLSDLNDLYGLRRSILRQFTTEKIYSDDRYGYWGNMDNKFMNKIGDHKAFYADASSHALSSAQYRYNRGKEAGEVMVKKMQSGEIKLQRDENGNVTETIKIISHSQGGAYAAGMSNVLTKVVYKVEVEYYISPKQPTDIPITNANRRVQYSSDKDKIAPQDPMLGNVEQGGSPGEDGYIDGHLIGSYENIFNKKKGSEGYVAPRKDITPQKENKQEGNSIKQNGGNIIGIIFCLMFLGSSCKNKEDKLLCLNQNIEYFNNNKQLHNIELNFIDSINDWTKRELKFMSQYKNVIWKVDAMIYNSNLNKLFGWTLVICKSNEKLDNVFFFTGEKINETWHFYIINMPSLWFDRTNNNNQPYSFEYLSRKAKEKVIEGGIINNNNSCSINDKYINNWIDRGDKNFKLWHQEFLNSHSEE